MFAPAWEQKMQTGCCFSEHVFSLSSHLYPQFEEACVVSSSSLFVTEALPFKIKESGLRDCLEVLFLFSHKLPAMALSYLLYLVFWGYFIIYLKETDLWVLFSFGFAFYFLKYYTN